MIDHFVKMKNVMKKDISKQKDALMGKKQEKEDIKVMKDNEKIRATDKLKKHMLEKIQVTKTGKN